MKTIFIAILVFIASFGSYQRVSPPEYRNFYGISWRGNARENLLYAKQMGYDCVFYQKGMENYPESNGLYFYIETPEYFIYDRKINSKGTYSEKEIEFYETYCRLNNTDRPFPFNLQTGWFFSDSTFSAQLNFQNKMVTAWAVDSIIDVVKSIQEKNPYFHFAGFAWDVPNLSGDFWKVPAWKRGTAKNTNDLQPPKSKVLPALDSAKEYSSYEYGRIQFYLNLYKKAQTINKDVHFIMEPFRIYDDFVRHFLNHKDAFRNIFKSFIISQESNGLEFVNDSRLYEEGLIRKDQVGSSSPNKFNDFDNRLIAANAAINGSWFSWFGRFGGSGDMPNYSSISQVPARIKLIRVLPNWENLNKISLNNRKWDGKEYKSISAIANDDYILVKQPNTKKFFLVFNTAKKRVQIPGNTSIKSIFLADGLFREIKDITESSKKSKDYIAPSSEYIGKALIINCD